MRQAIAILTVCLAGSAGWLAAATAEKTAAQEKPGQTKSTHSKSTQKKSTQSAGKKSTSGSAQSKSAPGKSTASKSTSGKSTAGKPTSSKSGKAKTHKAAPADKKTTSSQQSKKTAHGTPARSWRAGQTAPTPDRYKEIQTVLAQKGYLHGEPTGKWDDQSTDALRRFQQDQNLHATGKLDSLSIIALGLGPKYDASAEKPPAPQP